MNMKAVAISLLLVFTSLSCANKKDSSVIENKQLKQNITIKNNALMSLSDYLSVVENRIRQLKHKHGIDDFGLTLNVIEKDKIQLHLLNELKDIDQWIMKMESAILEDKYVLGLKDHALRQSNIELKEAITRLEYLKMDLENLYSDNASLATKLSELDNQLCEKELWANQLEANANRVFYAFGNSSELQKSGVVYAKKRFFGKNSKTTIRDDFNADYFTPADKRTITTLKFYSKSANLLTSHPKDSYEWMGEGQIESLTIIDPDLFWKNSNYLAVLVD